MSFLKKIGKFAKKAVKVYADYQTGGLASVATGALKRSAARRGVSGPKPMFRQPSFTNQALQSFQGGMIGEILTQLDGGVATENRTPLARLPSRARGLSGALRGEGFPRRKYRRINPGNIKALRRSIRRVHGAEKLFRQVLSVQGKKHGGIKPKSRKR